MQMDPVVTSGRELNLNSLYEPSFTSGWAADMMKDSFAFFILRVGSLRRTSLYM